MHILASLFKRELLFGYATCFLANPLLGAPFTPSEPTVSITSINENAARLEWPAGNGIFQLEESKALGPNAVWSAVGDIPVFVALNYQLDLIETNRTQFFRLARVIEPPTGTVPDPKDVASALPPNVFSDLADSTRFLYSGANPIQLGVAPGTIQSARAAVIRGKVACRDGKALGGVRVAVLNHPEYGYTFTRGDGIYDLAVNANQFTVDFQLAGYAPVQRAVQAGALNYSLTEDVLMVERDSLGTVVSFGTNAPAQLAMSSTNTDAAGPRSATVFIPAGTCASWIMPDGSTQDCRGLTLRVTEVTVGPNGPKAMPASLPPTSAYTYCAEFTGDEALAAGVKTVQFNQPVPVYVDNFLSLPVGTLVPIGNYDREQGAWLPAPNGIVLRVLGSANGMALIDLHGGGQPESDDVLAANGFSTAELQLLASLYSNGKTLWRAPVPHYSWWDFNFGVFAPDPNKPNKPGDKPQCSPCDLSGPRYGELNFSAQTFAEEIPLVGVPFALNYSSARVPDYKVDDILTIPVEWTPPPPPVCPTPAGGGGGQTGAACQALGPINNKPPTAIEVDTVISGEQSAQTLSPTNKFATVSWDGRDAYGRLVGGTREADINVAYIYPNGGYSGTCCGPELSEQFPALFGNAGDVTAFEGHQGANIGVGASFKQLLTYPDHRHLGLGGWSPTPLHRLDPAGGLVYYGDGRIRRVPQVDVQPDFLNSLGKVTLMAAAPDGSIYFFGYGPASGITTSSEQYIFRRHPGGSIETISAPINPLNVNTLANHQGVDDWSGIDGQPASNVTMHGASLRSLAVGPDGSVYVCNDYAVAKLTPDSTWHLVMGPGGSDFLPDGSLARQSSLSSNGGAIRMTVGPDGSAFVAGTWVRRNGLTYSMIRKVAPDGRLYTVFGGGGVKTGQSSPAWRSLYYTTAATASYSGVNITAMAAAADGSLFVSYSEQQAPGGVFRISPAGLILPFLEGIPVALPGYGYNPADTNLTRLILGDEGKLATQTSLQGSAPDNLKLGPDGSLYLSTGYLIWRVNRNGTVQRVAGRYGDPTYGSANLPGDGGDPLNTYFANVFDFAVAPDDSLVVSSAGPPVAPLTIFPGRASQQGILQSIALQFIPSADAREIDVFNASGMHLMTLDSLTGATNWVFGYDANSLVVTMTDRSGLVTRIERDGAGQPTAIVGSYGQRNVLTVDGNGFLSTVTNPAKETTVLTNSTGGLLLSITRPLGDTDSILYDNLGRAIQVTDPIQGGWTDTRIDVGVTSDLAYEADIACANSVGDTLTRVLRLQPNGDTVVDYATGGASTGSTVTKLNGDSLSRLSDGSTFSSTLGADPRFGNQAAQETQSTFTLPNGLVYKHGVQRTAGLANRFDPLSLTGLTNVTTINGNSYTEVYNPTNRTDTISSPEGRTDIATRDALGRMVHEVSPGQPPIDIAYDAAGRLATIAENAAAGVAITSFSYDALGQLKTVTDGLGRSNSFSYDAAGRLLQMTLSDGSTASLSRDSEGRPTSVTPPGRPAHTFQYNSVGLITAYAPPVVAADESVHYEYDRERSLTQIGLPDGQFVKLKRGLGGRVEQATLGAGPTLTYQYGTNVGSGYLRPANVSSTTGDSLQLDYLGSILTGVTWSGSIKGQVSLALNADLLPASQSVNGAVVDYAYDRDQQLIRAGDLTITRDAATGFATKTVLGVVTDQREYNDRGLLTKYVANTSGSPLASIELRYDLIGRLTNKVETVATLATTFDYVYDVASRLHQVWRNGTLTSTYTYDANGNRLTHNAETASYDVQDRIKAYAGSTFSWSPNGTLHTRTLGGQTTTYDYDVRGALTHVTPSAGQPIDYLNDPAGRRIGKKVSGALQRGWLWAESRPVAELDSSSTVTMRFVYASAADAPLYVIKGTNTYRLLCDERHSVRWVVNIADGAIGQQLDYDEFGRILSDTNPGFQPFGFAGGLYDPDTGLVRFGVRDYDPEVGRWAARDPIGFAGGSFSLFSYAGNDPINWIDLQGAAPTQPSPTLRNDVNRSINEMLQQPLGPWNFRNFTDHLFIWENDNLIRSNVKEATTLDGPSAPSPASPQPGLEPPSCSLEQQTQLMEELRKAMMERDRVMRSIIGNIR